MTEFVDELEIEGNLPAEKMKELLKFRNRETTEYLFEKARGVKEKFYRDDIYIRGTVELTNYCKNDCYYCGLQRSNRFITRYRLDEEDIMEYCTKAYEKGVKTFVLMGGDDYNFTKERVAAIIQMLKAKFSDCIIELCLGDRQESTYRAWFEAGATRYILWHESANDSHFKKLHPLDMSLLKRKQSLWTLKSIGYQVGSGFLVGTPYQMLDDVIEDLEFLKQLDPQIVHLAPFIPTEHTRFERERSGNGDMTLYLMAIIRLMLPRVLLTADTSLETIMADGRKKSFQAGVNEVFASISADEVKEYYNVYNRRLSRRNIAGDEVTRVIQKIEESGNSVGNGAGDYIYPPKSERVHGRIYHIM